MNSLPASLAESPPKALASRWHQLVAGIVCMMAISSPQYVWTLFTGPFTEKFGVSLAQLQVTFSLLIILQTFFSPVQGYLVDRFGIRQLVATGCVLSGLSWVLASQASSLTALYLSYGVVSDEAWLASTQLRPD
ncbi:MAG: hypothetical protein EOP02_31865, partial [Proteobacteria bacterium]